MCFLLDVENNAAHGLTEYLLISLVIDNCLDFVRCGIGFHCVAGRITENTIVELGDAYQSCTAFPDAAYIWYDTAVPPSGSFE